MRLVRLWGAGTLAAAVLFGACGGDRESGPGEVTTATSEDSPDVETRLYFPADGQRLRPESWELDALAEPEAKVRAVVQGLLQGPRAEGLHRPLPEDVELGQVVVSPDGVAYVDLLRPEQRTPPEQGSTQELLSVYSVVNSITLSVPQVRSVVLLWNGAQRPSLSGHVDSGRPLQTDRQWIAADAPGAAGPS